MISKLEGAPGVPVQSKVLRRQTESAIEVEAQHVQKDVLSKGNEDETPTAGAIRVQSRTDKTEHPIQAANYQKRAPKAE